MLLTAEVSIVMVGALCRRPPGEGEGDGLLGSVIVAGLFGLARSNGVLMLRRQRALPESVEPWLESKVE